MVDDDEDDCFIIKEALDESELDHSLTTMESGSELLDYLHGRGKYAGSKPEYPDLILLDLYLPGLSGSDILRYIRKNPQFGHLDVVVLTDSTDWSELSECYRLGATAVFSKGKWLETFAEIIRISGSYWFKFVTVQLDKTRPDSKSRHGV
jgi:CheY-like chemotaxis protein